MQEIAAGKEYPGGFSLLRLHTGGFALNFYKTPQRPRPRVERTQPAGDRRPLAAVLARQQRRRPQHGGRARPLRASGRSAAGTTGGGTTHPPGAERSSLIAPGPVGSIGCSGRTGSCGAPARRRRSAKGRRRRRTGSTGSGPAARRLAATATASPPGTPRTSRSSPTLGLTHHRLSIEWARIEPEPGVHDAAAVAHYRDVLTAAPRRRRRAVGVPAPLHAARAGSPRRAASSSSDNRTDAWARHVDFVAETFGDLVAGLAAGERDELSTPSLALPRRWLPARPRRPRRVGAVADRGHPPRRRPRPRCGCKQTGAPVVVDLRALGRRRPGRRSAPRRGSSTRLYDDQLGDRASACSATACCACRAATPVERPDLAGAFDLIGFSYYATHRRPRRAHGRRTRRTRRVSPLGYGIWADGLGLVLDRLHDEVPGVAAARRRVRHRHRRRRRARRYLERGLAGRRTTRSRGGIDVRGFFHWTARRQLRVAPRLRRRVRDHRPRPHRAAQCPGAAARGARLSATFLVS